MPALAAQLCHLDDDFGGQIGAVVEKVVLSEGRVARRLDGQPALFVVGIEPDGLVDDVAVSAQEPPVASVQFSGDEISEPLGRD